jgi:hypothetical protein
VSKPRVIVLLAAAMLVETIVLNAWRSTPMTPTKPNVVAIHPAPAQAQTRASLMTEDDVIELLLTKEIMVQLGVWQVRYSVWVSSNRFGNEGLSVTFSAASGQEKRAEMQKDVVQRQIEDIVQNFLKSRKLTVRNVRVQYA